MSHNSYHQDQESLGSIEVTAKKSNMSFVERPLELHSISELKGFRNSVTVYSNTSVFGKGSIDLSEYFPTGFNTLRCCFIKYRFAN